MATFLVTGASSGIGEASALRLDRLGHRVYAGVRSSKDGERLQAVASPQLRPVMADVTDPDQIGATMAIIDDEVGRPAWTVWSTTPVSPSAGRSSLCRCRSGAANSRSMSSVRSR